MLQNNLDTYASFYKSNEDLFSALNLVTEILRDIQNPDSQLKRFIPVYENGKICKLEDVAKHIREVNPKLGYVTRDHMIELFFKDKERKLMIKDREYIYYRKVSYVQPPPVLYFGTVEALLSRVMTYGIKSHTKGFIRLYDSVLGAKNFAKQFATRIGDKIVALEVDALSSFSDGSKFSTHEAGEYIVAKIERIYIKGLVKESV